MSRLTLVFTICSVIIAGAHFALVNGEAASDQLESPVDDQEEASERSGQASANANARATLGNRNGVLRLRPVNSLPLNPAIMPAQSMTRPTKHYPGSCYSCQGCDKVYNTSTLSLYCDRVGCVTYSEKYVGIPSKENWVVRGCISDLGTCVEILNKNEVNGMRVLSCSECFGDNCNDKSGAGSAVLNHCIAAMAVLAAPILTKSYFSTM